MPSNIRFLLALISPHRSFAVRFFPLLTVRFSQCNADTHKRRKSTIEKNNDWMPERASISLKNEWIKNRCVLKKETRWSKKQFWKCFIRCWWWFVIIIIWARSARCAVLCRRKYNIGFCVPISVCIYQFLKISTVIFHNFIFSQKTIIIQYESIRSFHFFSFHPSLLLRFSSQKTPNRGMWSLLAKYLHSLNMFGLRYLIIGRRTGQITRYSNFLWAHWQCMRHCASF